MTQRILTMKQVRAVVALIASVVALLFALPIVVLGSPLWTVALLTRLCARLLRPKGVPLSQIMEFAPILGWKPKAHLDTHYLAVDGEVCHISTDAHGWPGKMDLYHSEVVVF